MENSLNEYFVIFKIFKDGELVNEFECPKSLIQAAMNTWKYPGSTYTVHVIDHTGNFRINSDLFDQMVIN